MIQHSEPIWYFQIGGRAESQRDSATKPRVARNELPWDGPFNRTTTLKGLWPTATAAQRGHNPVGVVKHRPPLPRVARPSQPWALLRNPFGILSGNLCRIPASRAGFLTSLWSACGALAISRLLNRPCAAAKDSVMFAIGYWLPPSPSVFRQGL